MRLFLMLVYCAVITGLYALLNLLVLLWLGMGIAY